MTNPDNEKEDDWLRHRSVGDKKDTESDYGTVVIEQVKMKKEVGLVGGISLIVGTIIGTLHLHVFPISCSYPVLSVGNLTEIIHSQIPSLGYLSMY